MPSAFLLVVPLLLGAEPARTAAETKLDKTRMVSVFGGDCRVKWTRSELLLDIDPNPPGTAGPMRARTRLILTPFTAKRLAAAMATTLQRHEDLFGTVEVPEKKGQNVEGMLDSNLAVVYSNFCRVTATPEEVIVDFAQNDDPFGAAARTLTIDRRIILTPAGGKALLTDLAKALTAYEAEVGAIELDVRKRAKKKLEP